MIASIIAHELIGLYLVATLAATSLAKLKNWRMSALGVRWGKIVPARLAATTIIVVSVAELLLAAALTLGRAALLVGYVTAVLFFSFGCYQLVVAVKTRLLTCTCAGNIRMSQATLSAMIGAVSASVVQAGLAWAWVFLGSAEHGATPHIVAVSAWIPPLVALFQGRRYTRKRTRHVGVSIRDVS